MSRFDCSGKRRYNSFAEAERTAKYRHEQIDEILHAYRCKICRGYHIGTVSETKRQEERAKRRRKMEPVE